MKVSEEFSGLLNNLVIVIILMWCYCCRLEKVRSKNPAWSCLRFTRSSHTPIVSRTVKITTIQLLRKTSWETRHLNVGFMTFDEKKLARIIYKPHDVDRFSSKRNFWIFYYSFFNYTIAKSFHDWKYHILIKIEYFMRVSTANVLRRNFHFFDW